MEDQRKPHFFQVMLGDFKNKLQIPLRFLKYICSISSDRVVLQGPSGGRWPVRLNRTSDGVYLEDGWGSFSRAHSLRTGEFVMLRYDGYEHFSVRIFGSDALERDTTCTVASSPKVTKCDEIKRRGRPPKVGRMIRKKSPSTFLISSSHTPNAENHKKKCVLKRRKSHKFDRSDSEAKEINHKRSTFLKHCSRKAEYHEEDCVLERRPYQFDQSDSYKGTSDTSEEGGAIETANTLMDGNPSFSIIMQPSYKYYLPIPRSFSEQYFGKYYESAILTLWDGRTWYVQCVKRRGDYRLGTGWRDFRKALQLTNGSVCVFEMIRRKSLVLKVHICRDA